MSGWRMMMDGTYSTPWNIFQDMMQGYFLMESLNKIASANLWVFAAAKENGTFPLTSVTKRGIY